MFGVFLATALYAIIGGPSVGKTSIVKELQEMGEVTVREVATDIILERQSLGVEEPWLEENFQLNILLRHLEREKEAKGKRIFCDRGILDAFVYLDIRNRKNTQEYQKVELLLKDMDIKNHYDAVFYVLPYNGEGFQPCKTEARSENLEEALKICRLTEKVYKEHCPQIVIVPAHLTPKERANFILDQAQKIEQKHPCS